MRSAWRTWLTEAYRWRKAKEAVRGMVRARKVGERERLRVSWATWKVGREGALAMEVRACEEQAKDEGVCEE